MAGAFGRLRSPEVSELLRRGKAARGALLTLHALPLSPGERSRGAVIAGKRAAKGAAERNLLQRRGRALLREAARDLARPYAVLLTFRPEAVKRPFRDLRTEFTSLLSSTGALRGGRLGVQ